MNLLFKLKEMKPIFPRAFYYSFSMAYIIVITWTLIMMFFAPRGVVPVYEPNLAIRVTEIGIGLWLVGYSIKLLRTDFRRFIIEYYRRRRFYDRNN